MAEKSQLEEVKANIRSLIQSQPNQVYTIMELQKDYKGHMGHNLPLLGHREVEHFLRNIPDVVKVNGHGPLARLEYIPTNKSKHIGEMIKHQKQNTGKRRGHRGKRANKNYYKPQNTIQFPHDSDESDWDKPTMDAIEKEEPRNKVQINTSIDNEAPENGEDTTVYSGSVLHAPEEKKSENPRTRFLRELRKRCVHRESVAPSSSSSQSSEVNADTNERDNETRTTGYKGYKYILAKIRQSEAASKEAPTEPVHSSRFMQLTRRSRPKHEVPSKSCNNDDEEAIPASAVTDVIERMNTAQISHIPSGPALSEISVPQHNIHEKFKTGDILQLVICEIDNPLKFFFQLSEGHEEFMHLQSEIHDYYTILARDELRIAECNLHANLTCMVYFEDNWHRAMVCTVPDDPNEFTKIKLFLIDRGLYCELTSRHLKFLLPRFAHTAAQAICGRLANIKIKAYASESQASLYFKKLTLKNTLYGYVKSVGAKNQQVELILLDTNVTPKRRIHEELIKVGLVEPA